MIEDWDRYGWLVLAWLGFFFALCKYFKGMYDARNDGSRLVRNLKERERWFLVLLTCVLLNYHLVTSWYLWYVLGFSAWYALGCFAVTTCVMYVHEGFLKSHLQLYLREVQVYAKVIRFLWGLLTFGRAESDEERQATRNREDEAILALGQGNPWNVFRIDCMVLFDVHSHVANEIVKINDEINDKVTRGVATTAILKKLDKAKRMALNDQTQINTCKFVFVTVMPMRFLIAFVIGSSYGLYLWNDRRRAAAVHRGIYKFVDDPDDVLRRIQDAQ
jgi:hypothetical protein